MPEIKVKHVVSFSSEDRSYPADNLLKPEGTSKWKSGASGEKNVVCVLQLEKAVKISQIDIGNEGSAFVEVLVGRSTDSDDDYKVILVASSFMSPSESRTNQNVNRVRLFSDDKLSNSATSEKWDRVKVVCSQPFNKTVKYGLSFIKLHSPSDGTETSKPKQSTLGGFALKADPENGSELRAGTLFANRNKETVPSPPLTGAAAARAATRAVDASPKPSPKPSPAHREERKIKTEDVTERSSTPPQLKRKHSSGSTEERTSKNQAKLHRQSQSSSSVKSERSHKDDDPPLKKTKSDPTSERGSRPLSEVMRKVVFVLSGYQNPERANIRDKAIEMGATYKPGWGDGCTHLICAFGNTPKYNAVKKRGRIVTKDWITQCYKKERLLPWRKFRLGNAPTPPGSETEDSEEESAPPVKREKSVKESRVKEVRSNSPVASSSTAKNDSDDPAFYEGSTDEEMDTDDEIERVRASSKNHSKPDTTASPRPGSLPATVDYDQSTDESDTDDVTLDLPPLPDFFTNKHFFFYGSKIPAKERRLLYRYIIAYNGKLEEYMNEHVEFVLSNDAWDDNFDEAVADNPTLSFVKPAWIHACYDKQKFLPHQKFVIVPQ